MPRIRLTDEEQEDVEADAERRRAIDVIRWSYFDRDGVDPEQRRKYREMADRYLRDVGILYPWE
jgi:hypothetical protein